MYKYGKSCIKKLLYCMAICIAILAVSIGVMWGLSSDYKLYGVPVLNYHQINDEKHSALTLHVDQFKEQMEYLHNHGYNTITLNQLYDYLQNGSDLPEKPIVITFDDGYVDHSFRLPFPYSLPFRLTLCFFLLLTVLPVSLIFRIKYFPPIAYS